MPRTSTRETRPVHLEEEDLRTIPGNSVWERMERAAREGRQQKTNPNQGPSTRRPSLHYPDSLGLRETDK